LEALVWKHKAQNRFLALELRDQVRFFVDIDSYKPFGFLATNDFAFDTKFPVCVFEVEFRVVLGRHFLGIASGWGSSFCIFTLKPIYNLQT